MQDARHAHATVRSRSFCMLNVAYFHVGDFEISRTAPEPCVCHCWSIAKWSTGLPRRMYIKARIPSWHGIVVGIVTWFVNRLSLCISPSKLPSDLTSRRWWCSNLGRYLPGSLDCPGRPPGVDVVLDYETYRSRRFASKSSRDVRIVCPRPNRFRKVVRQLTKTEFTVAGWTE
jgi:hypothetical protein